MELGWEGLGGVIVLPTELLSALINHRRPRVQLRPCLSCVRACSLDVEVAKFQLHSLRRLWKNTHPSAQGRVHLIANKMLASIITVERCSTGFSLHRFIKKYVYCSRCKASSSTISSPSISCWSRDLAMPSRYIPRVIGTGDAHLVTTCCSQNNFWVHSCNISGPTNSGIAGSAEKKDWPLH